MPTATPSSSHSPPDKSGWTGPFIPPSLQFLPKTPERKRGATRSVPDRTPLSVGTSILKKLSPDPDQSPKYDRAKYEEYKDLESHRVFVDIEVFMKHVLHVPENWRELWGQSIERIKRDEAFLMAYLDYSSQCETEGPEERLYKPLADMASSILRNDPQRVRLGVMNDISPDLVAVHDDFIPHLHAEARKEQCIKPSHICWVHPLQILKVKPSGGALVDGSSMPRLKVNGRDPREDHAYPYTPRKRKRPADESSESSRKTVKAHHRSTPGGASGQVTERRPRQPQTNETRHQKGTYLQIGRYLLEQLSIPAFRSHVTIGLVDRDRIQFYHANHSVILVSSGINFLQSDDGLTKFIAIVIAFGKLSLRDNGILHDLHDGRMFRDNEKLPTSALAPGAMQMQEGNTLVFGGDEKTEPFTLTYGEVISREPSLAGRSTVVLHAKSPRWGELDLVVKISWPGSDRVAESASLARAIETAESTETDEWALKHLPQVLFAQDVVFDSNSTHEKVARLFDNAEFVDREYKYERRTLRIIVQERLYPLRSLTNAKDIAQVLLDTGCIHRWLYVRAGILHRDISLSNIMYRIVEEENEAGVIEEKVCGVLIDFGLASFTEDLRDYTKTSQQRMGTPPFMAYELLRGLDAHHLYRHDLESLFYVMLVLVTHYEIQLPTEEEGGGLYMRQGFKELPYGMWFGQPSYEALASLKRAFFSSLRHFNLSPDFEDFRDWLWDLRLSFRRGIRAKDIHEDGLMILRRCQSDGSENKAASQFDDETLEGYLDYSALIGPVRGLKGELEGLIIRYDPSISTSTAQVDSSR